MERLKKMDLGGFFFCLVGVKSRDRELEMEGLDLFSNLPEGCISHIISFTSPLDACRSSAVCSIFRSASESDMVWERFLPSGYPDILAGSASPVQFSSKKDLFLQLLNPILIDEGKMSFSIDKMTGKKCYMLSARKLRFSGSGGPPRFGIQTSLRESRFQEVAEFVQLLSIEIIGRIDAHIFSPKTTYKVYLVLKFGERAYGLDHYLVRMSVKLGGHISINKAFFLQALSSRADGQDPQARGDQWMEIEMGEFFNDEGEEGDLVMIFRDIRDENRNSGIPMGIRLIVEGIEIRPVWK